MTEHDTLLQDWGENKLFPKDTPGGFHPLEPCNECNRDISYREKRKNGGYCNLCNDCCLRRLDCPHRKHFTN
jgi:hypothetical protein